MNPFEPLDKIIEGWAFLHDLKLVTYGMDREIRCSTVGKYTISLSRPNGNLVKVNFIHQTNPLKTKVITTDIEHLRDTLENLYDIAEKI